MASYVVQNFTDGQVLYASHLNNIEQGIVDLAAELTESETAPVLTIEEASNGYLLTLTTYAGSASITIPDAEVTEEEIAALVEAYLAENPIEVEEETDPTVPDWAKAETKPTYTAEEVGAVTEDEMTAAIAAAIADLDLSAYATTEEVAAAIEAAVSAFDLSAYSTTEEMSAAIAEAVAALDLSGYVTEEDVTAAVTAALSGYATTEYVDDAVAGAETGLSSEEVQALIDAAVAGIDLSAYAESTAVTAEIEEAISNLDLSAYSTTEEVNAAIAAAIAALDLSGYLTNDDLADTAPRRRWKRSLQMQSPGLTCPRTPQRRR